MSEVKLLTPAALPDGTAPDAWLAALPPRFGPAERATLADALACAREWDAGAALPTGEAELQHDVRSAAIAVELGMDHESVAAALLMHAHPPAGDAVRERFGERVAGLVEGAARMAQIEALGANSAQHADASAQLESLRKMLLAMVQDIRVVLLKLASHTQTLRFLVKSADGEARVRAAQLAQDMFAPLANRLGLWQLKWELEDLAFRIREPDLYKRIAGMLDEKRVEREAFIAQCTRLLSAELRRAGLTFEITGRPKHIYSIFKKMQRKNVDFHELYDVTALRVFVQDVKDCYAALGVVHSLWTPIAREFDDYIAKPKGNDYRSLHTAVVGPGGRVLEVQIRTREMHEQAEYGVAAHWRYKEGTPRDGGYDERIAWLRRILDWKEELGDADEVAERLQAGLFEETVYVLTPQGRVVHLPAGSTPVDFAYHIHSDLGHRCRGARVDGAMVPLNTRLGHGQVVEILAAKQGGPSRDWLNPALGYTASHRARAKVRQWFNARNLQASIAQGRSVLDKELQRTGLTALKHDALAARLGYGSPEALLADVGRGEVGQRQLQTALRALVEPPPGEPAAAVAPAVAPAARDRARQAQEGILLVGVDKLMSTPARCCKPAPPDPIVGFVTRGRGVMIHRASCPNLRQLPPERLIDADWGERTSGAFEVDIEIESVDRTGLLRDITDVLGRERVNVVGANTVSRGDIARMRFTVQVGDLERLRAVLAMLAKVPGVRSARRR